MRKKMMTKLLIALLASAFVLPSGFAVYSMISGQIGSGSMQEGSTALPMTEPVNTDIPDEIQDLIRQSDPANFDKNITNYKNMLVRLDVHSKFKSEIERLVKVGHKLPDILISYDFLNDCFGQRKDIEILVKSKESGKSWTAVFQEYKNKHPEFVPRSFKPDDLEKLMNTQGITSDDIMIADRVSQNSGESLNGVMDKKIAGASWKEINAALDIVNAQAQIPHVPVTPEQIDSYVNEGMEKEKVVLAFVIAMKMEKNVSDIILKIKSGNSAEQIYEECYTQKYY